MSRRLTDITGRNVWSKHARGVDIVLSHSDLPRQRTTLRSAALEAALIPAGRADKHLHYIDETTAAARYFVSKLVDVFDQSQVRRLRSRQPYTSLINESYDLDFEKGHNMRCWWYIGQNR